MGRPRIYASSLDRVRAWRAKERAERLEEERRKQQAEASFRSQCEAEFCRLWDCMLAAVFKCRGLMPEEHGECMQVALQKQRGALFQDYWWERRFPRR